MNAKKLFSVLTSFMFLCAPKTSRAKDNSECILCLDAVPEHDEDKIKTTCNHEFCKDHLIEWWRKEEKQALKEGSKFLPLCPVCKEAQSIELYNQNLPKCPICLTEMSGKVTTVKTKCGHQFCKQCLKKWLDKKDSCPCCRKINPCGGQTADTFYEEAENLANAGMLTLFAFATISSVAMVINEEKM